MEKELKDLVDRHIIEDALANYCRAMDRMDRETAEKIWHDNGTADYHDFYKGSGLGFIDQVWLAHKNLERHSHQLTNTLIQIDGDFASSESYVTIAIWTRTDQFGKQIEIVSRGRYLDRWSRRRALWALDHREHIVDLQTVRTLAKGHITAASSRSKADPSYLYLSDAKRNF